MHSYAVTKLITNSIFCLLILSILVESVAAQQDCVMLQDGINMETKMYIREVAPSLLFNHTPPEVKNDLLTDNLMECQAQVIKKEDKVYLHLNLHVHSKLAPSIYGGIPQGNLLKVTLINGREVDLKCYAGSNGVLMDDQSGYIYPLGFTLEKSTQRTLQKKAIDKIGIQWTTGYEEYVIYEVDFFMNQLGCLNQTTQKLN